MPAQKNTTTVASAAKGEGKNFIKHEWDQNKDWSYLADKEPDASHHLKAELMNRFGPEGFEITPHQVMVFLAMHRWTQKSDVNQSRQDFRGRTWASVQKGYETLAERAAQEIAEHGEDVKMVKNPIVTGLTAEEVLEGVLEAPEAPKEAKEVAEKALEEAKPAAKKAPAKKAPAASKAPATRQRRTPRKAATAKAEA